MNPDGVHLISISDAQLALLGSDGVLHSEPGAAITVGKQLLFGRDATRALRRRPRAAVRSFWSELGHEQSADGQSHAELAHAQLGALWRSKASPDDPAVLIVPPYYFDRDQLGLLLGIAEDCGIRVRAMVESPVAASCEPWPDVALLHLELDENDCVLTLLDQEEGVRRRECRVLADHGLWRYREALLQQASRAFLTSPTRFDVFGSGDSEQAVFDALFEAPPTASGESEGCMLSVVYRGRRYEAPLEASAFETAAAKLVQAIRGFVARAGGAAAPLGIQLGARAAALPGLVAALQNLDAAKLRCLPPNADLEGARARLASFGPDEAVRLLTTLSWPTGGGRAEASRPQSADRRRPGAAPAERAEAARPQSADRRRPGAAPAGAAPTPTHLRVGDLLHALGANPLLLEATGQPLPAKAKQSAAGLEVSLRAGQVFLNGEAARAAERNGKTFDPAQPLALGDRIALKTGVELHFVAVTRDGA